LDAGKRSHGACYISSSSNAKVCCLLLPMFHDLCTCLLETTAGFAKMAEPIEVPFRLYTRAGSRNPVLDGTWILPLEGALLEYIHGHFVACHGDVLDTVNICCKVAACAACSR